MREVFAQAPIGEREGAIALGATRWGMIRAVVIPFGRAGIVGAVMLGLGRALGETIVVYAIISPAFGITTRPLAERHQHHRLPHRLALLRVERARALGPARSRARALPVHPGHQHPRRCGGQPIALRRRHGDLMTTLLAPDTATTGPEPQDVRRPPRQVRIGGPTPAGHPRSAPRPVPGPDLAGLRASGPDDRRDRLLAVLVRRVPRPVRRASAPPRLDRVGVTDRLVGALVTTAGLIMVALPGRHRRLHVRARPAGPVAPELLHPDHGLHRARGAAEPGRHRRRDGGHARAGRHLGGAQRAAGHRHRGLPQRGARPPGPSGAHGGGGHERASRPSWPACSSTRC